MSDGEFQHDIIIVGYDVIGLDSVADRLRSRPSVEGS